MRGAHGGYQLARPPEEIEMLDVVQALEGPIAPMECFHEVREGRVLCSHEADGVVPARRRLLWTRVTAGSPRRSRDDARGAVGSPTSTNRRHGGRSRLVAGAADNETETMADLEIRNLHVSADGKQILKGLDLEVRQARSTR